MSARSYTLFLSLFLILFSEFARIYALALTSPTTPSDIRGRQASSSSSSASTPVFPADPPSCPKCADSYASINSCASAAPIFENATMIIFNPGAFVDVIKCACTDTFQAAYPQCVDCFIQTNQTEFLSASSDDLPKIVSGIRSVCALESTLLGNVSAGNSEVPSSAASTAALPTQSSALASTAVHQRFKMSALFAPLLLGTVEFVSSSCFV